MPFRHEFTVAVNYALPAGLGVSAALVSYPGTALGVNWINSQATRNADGALGDSRTDACDAGVPLIQPGTKFGIAGTSSISASGEYSVRVAAKSRRKWSSMP
jgi:hypothetical protein